MKPRWHCLTSYAHHFLKPLLPNNNLDPDWYTCGYHGKDQNLVTEQWWEEGHLEEHAIYQLNKRDQIQAAFTTLSLVSISVNLRITRYSYSILSLFKKVTVRNHPFYFQQNAHSKYLGISQQARVEPQGVQGFSPSLLSAFLDGPQNFADLRVCELRKASHSVRYWWQPAGLQMSPKGLTLDRCP